MASSSTPSASTPSALDLVKTLFLAFAVTLKKHISQEKCSLIGISYVVIARR